VPISVIFNKSSKSIKNLRSQKTGRQTRTKAFKDRIRATSQYSCGQLGCDGEWGYKNSGGMVVLRSRRRQVPPSGPRKHKFGDPPSEERRPTIHEGPACRRDTTSVPLLEKTECIYHPRRIALNRSTYELEFLCKAGLR